MATKAEVSSSSQYSSDQLSETIKDRFLKPLLFPEVQRDTRSFYDEKHDIPIPCLQCDVVFDDAQARETFLQHSFTKHKIVIHRVCDIVSYKCYAEYWKRRLKENDITQLTPVIQTHPETSDPPENFYLFSDSIPEDKELRLFLQRKRLESLLEIQQQEREDTSFSRVCLFCSEKFTGNRKSLFQHMLTAHNFNIGQPDNIVFVNEFLDILQQKLDNLQCLYCERTFRDISTLRDHMRKKQHRRINSSNKSYDKYYMINYLEMGKSWQEIHEEDDKHHDSGSLKKGDVYKDEDFDEEENDEFCIQLTCLFCSVSVNNLTDINNHMKNIHHFDLLDVLTNWKQDYYYQIKLINYMRRQIHSNTCIHCQKRFDSSSNLLNHMTTESHFSLPPDQSIWNQPQYLFPTYENDGLLYVLDSDT